RAERPPLPADLASRLRARPGPGRLHRFGTLDAERPEGDRALSGHARHRRRIEARRLSLGTRQQKGPRGAPSVFGCEALSSSELALLSADELVGVVGRVLVHADERLRRVALVVELDRAGDTVIVDVRARGDQLEALRHFAALLAAAARDR